MDPCYALLLAEARRRRAGLADHPGRSEVARRYGTTDASFSRDERARSVGLSLPAGLQRTDTEYMCFWLKLCSYT